MISILRFELHDCNELLQVCLVTNFKNMKNDNVNDIDDHYDPNFPSSHDGDTD